MPNARSSFTESKVFCHDIFIGSIYIQIKLEVFFFQEIVLPLNRETLLGSFT